MSYRKFIIFLYNLTNSQFPDCNVIIGRFGTITKNNRKGLIIGNIISDFIVIIFSLIKIPVSLWLLSFVVFSIIISTHAFSFGFISYFFQWLKYKYNNESYQLIINEFTENQEQYNHIYLGNKSFYIERKNTINFFCFKGILSEKKRYCFLKIKIFSNKVILKNKSKKYIIKNKLSLDELKIEIAKTALLLFN